MSPISSEPPPRFSSSGITSRPRSGLSFVARPTSGTFSSCWSALASAMSASLHRSEEHTSELQSHSDLVCRLLLEKKKEVHIKVDDSREIDTCVTKLYRLPSQT